MRRVSANIVTRCFATLSLFLAAGPAFAEDLTAGVVMTKMNAEQRSAYMQGIIEGLAYARYTKDGKSTEGMSCIYKWFYAEGTIAKVDEAFLAFPDYFPGAVMSAMATKECGQ